MTANTWLNFVWFRLPKKYWLTIFVLVAVIDIAVKIGVPAVSQYMDDHIWRPQFVKGCAGVNWTDERYIVLCNRYYEQHRALDERGWRPLEDSR